MHSSYYIDMCVQMSLPALIWRVAHFSLADVSRYNQSSAKAHQGKNLEQWFHCCFFNYTKLTLFYLNFVILKIFFINVFNTGHENKLFWVNINKHCEKIIIWETLKIWPEMYFYTKETQFFLDYVALFCVFVCVLCNQLILLLWDIKPRTGAVISRVFLM